MLSTRDYGCGSRRRYIHVQACTSPQHIQSKLVLLSGGFSTSLPSAVEGASVEGAIVRRGQITVGNTGFEQEMVIFEIVKYGCRSLHHDK